MNYRLAYALGFHPWEDGIETPEFVEHITALLDREERGLEPPFGPALDIGTGSGIWALELARRGWQVTGVDRVERALARARERINGDVGDVRLVNGDVTALGRAGVGSGFRLLLDTGTFHGLSDSEREAMGREITAAAAPDATLLMLVWPRRRRPLIRGADREDVERALPAWRITDVEVSDFSLPKPLEIVMRPDERWYRLRLR